MAASDDYVAEHNIDKYGLNINISGSMILAKNHVTGIQNLRNKKSSQKVLTPKLNKSFNSSKAASNKKTPFTRNNIRTQILMLL